VTLRKRIDIEKAAGKVFTGLVKGERGTCIVLLFGDDEYVSIEADACSDCDVEGELTNWYPARWQVLDCDQAIAARLVDADQARHYFARIAEIEKSDTEKKDRAEYDRLRKKFEGEKQ
jgi:hypothetical protein